jgi:integrative and conjugative element protein (TIGR02256 family)
VADSPRLLVAQALLDRLHELPRRPWEVGGWMLGYWTDRRDTLVVTHGTPPAARGTALGITISGKGHRRRFDEAWARSNGHVTFLGDWHTHPRGPAVPSRTDHRAMRQLAEDGDYGTPEPLIAIASVPRLHRTASVQVAFFLRHRDGRVMELTPTGVAELPPATQAVPDWPWPRQRHRAAARATASRS